MNTSTSYFAVGHDKTEGRDLLAGTIAPSARDEVCRTRSPSSFGRVLMLHPKLLRCRTDATRCPIGHLEVAGSGRPAIDETRGDGNSDRVSSGGSGLREGSGRRGPDR